MPESTPVIPFPAAAATAPTLRQVALAAIASSLGDPPPGRAPEEAFLLENLRAVPGPGGWRGALQRCLDGPAAGDLPLVRLSRVLGLTVAETLAVALAAAVEEDVMVGRVMAYLQAPLGGSRPTLSFLAACLGSLVPRGVRPVEALAAGAAARSGLLAVLGDGLPLPERTVAVPLHLCEALAGSDGTLAGCTVGMGALPPVPLADGARAAAERHAGALSAAAGHVLVVRASSPGEGRAAACLVAAAAGRRAVFVEGDPKPGLGPWLVSRDLLPVFCCDVGPGERYVVPPVPAYGGPVLALCGPDGNVESAGGVVVSWRVPVPPAGEREALWREALGAPALAAELAAQHRHGSGRIAQLGRMARHLGRVEGRVVPSREDVLAAARGGEGAGLGSLVQPLTADVPEEALVAGPTLRAELEMLVLRCRMRDGLVDGLGVSAAVRYTPGVRALLVGPSGTGKTLAAGWLATRLGLPLYRVDLASVTSKYIGETEKNLAQLLARAEAAEVVLLFDEADSLFGKRTDVRDSNDRFANAQTNYLLQRIETFDGIALLTSNSRTRFDSAFTRRLDAILEFPLPGPEERRALWEAHLGGGHALEARDLNRLAANADLGGGHIRNAVLGAAVLAGAAGRPIGLAEVLQALGVEYRKLGKQVPVGLRG